MAGDTIGSAFRVTNWGESHGAALGAVIEGCPPGLKISEAILQEELERRRPGQSALTTARAEKDQVKIFSGIFEGKTTGAPLLLLIGNQDQRSKDYKKLSQLFRPSHADFTYFKKYGIRDPRGGGRSSARLTAGTVAAGAVAKALLKKEFNTRVVAYVKTVSHLSAEVKAEQVTRKQVEANAVRCPDQERAQQMAQLIAAAKEEGDSLGGIIECVVHEVPVGLGEPLYDKLEADLAKAVLSINACRGFEIGSGFAGTALKGSQHNDSFYLKNGTVAARTNNSGGIQGGISNGMPIIFRAAFKPTATILQKQQTLSKNFKAVEFTATGRHDPCVLPRAVPIVEAAAALVLVDHALRHRAQIGSF